MVFDASKEDHKRLVTSGLWELKLSICETRLLFQLATAALDKSPLPLTVATSVHIG